MISRKNTIIYSALSYILNKFLNLVNDSPTESPLKRYRPQNLFKLFSKYKLFLVKKNRSLKREP